MLSTRGSSTTQSIITEALASCKAAGKILCVPEAERTWKATSAIIRQQVLLGHAISVPRFGGFWAKQRHVATDGPNKYLVRQLKFGFAPGFVTTYSLDAMVDQMDPRIKFIKLPIDLISQAANVPADIASTILHEIFLFIGEGIHKGRTFHIEFDELINIGVKKERAITTPNPQLESDFFTIDSRKWPAGVRSMAALQIEKERMANRPGSSSSTRPSSRASSLRPSSSRPSSLRPGSARSMSNLRPTTSSSNLAAPRPLFVTALPRDKSFREIETMPIRAVMPLRKGPSARVVPPQTRRVDPMSLQSLVVNDTDREEESVYDILSPPRQFPDEPIRRATPTIRSNNNRCRDVNPDNHGGFEYSPNQGYSEERRIPDAYSYDDEGEDMAHHRENVDPQQGSHRTTTIPAMVERKKSDSAIHHHELGRSASALFPWEAPVKVGAPVEEEAARSFGRKRFEDQVKPLARHESAQSLLYDNLL